MIAPTTRKFNFTESIIANLPFAEKGQRYTVYDTGVKNLALRVGNTTKVYYMVKKIGNNTVYYKIGDAGNTSVKNARIAMSEPIKAANKGENPNATGYRIDPKITVQDFFDNEYFPNHSELRKSVPCQKMDKIVIRSYIPPEIRRMRMLDITRGDMEHMHNSALSATESVYSANRALKLMRQMFNKAIDWGMPCTNPAARIPMFPEVQRDRFLQPDELPRFWEALAKETDFTFRNFITLCILLGQRRRNMQSIRWPDIHLDRGILYIQKTKNGEPQAVPLPTQAIDILRDEIFINETIVSNTPQTKHKRNTPG